MRSVVKLAVSKSRDRDRADCSMILRFSGKLQTNKAGCTRFSEAYQCNWVLPLEAYRCCHEEYIRLYSVKFQN